ncbi:hypothetical protein GGTG_07940 [Gaeumannomyces tritici R3-111a-1]|uniref:Integral membrane protein n=1 Tax=Gaeumannomyces tritici (strain R3-111a-1) TaxID=644352 RepID=J3P350_GAET3|nr:hypothetical protein GGTG_07940 [Gaeumannomyces tritici R3-111a-1]EJT74092.1 hypothetical protein GGTG_07940 [Gaeumannomyces tritici R3-111a-1]
MITLISQYIVLTFILLSSTVVLAQSDSRNDTANGGQTCPKDLPGFTLNGNDCKVLCRSARWLDVFLFFVGNYVAHAATVPSRPGQSTFSTGVAILTALLLPGGGISHAISTIATFAVLKPTPLRAAASAGAICAVIKAPIIHAREAINLLGNLACPQYDCMYIVDSAALREINDWRERGSTSDEDREKYKVEGVVGTLDETADHDLQPEYQPRDLSGNAYEEYKLRYLRHRRRKNRKRLIWEYVLTFMVAAVPLVIVGAISSFRSGQSTVEERAWTMAWLACGLVGQALVAPAQPLEGRPFINTGAPNRHLYTFIYLWLILTFGVPSIGGMVIVGRMIRDFGVCGRRDVGRQGSGRAASGAELPLLGRPSQRP